MHSISLFFEHAQVFAGKVATQLPIVSQAIKIFNKPKTSLQKPLAQKRVTPSQNLPIEKTKNASRRHFKPSNLQPSIYAPIRPKTEQKTPLQTLQKPSVYAPIRRKNDRKKSMLTQVKTTKIEPLSVQHKPEEIVPAQQKKTATPTITIIPLLNLSHPSKNNAPTFKEPFSKSTIPLTTEIVDVNLLSNRKRSYNLITPLKEPQTHNENNNVQPTPIHFLGKTPESFSPLNPGMYKPAPRQHFVRRLGFNDTPVKNYHVGSEKDEYSPPSSPSKLVSPISKRVIYEDNTYSTKSDSDLAFSKISLKDYISHGHVDNETLPINHRDNENNSSPTSSSKLARVKTPISNSYFRRHELSFNDDSDNQIQFLEIKLEDCVFLEKGEKEQEQKFQIWQDPETKQIDICLKPVTFVSETFIRALIIKIFQRSSDVNNLIIFENDLADIFLKHGKEFIIFLLEDELIKFNMYQKKPLNLYIIPDSNDVVLVDTETGFFLAWKEDPEFESTQEKDSISLTDKHDEDAELELSESPYTNAFPLEIKEPTIRNPYTTTYIDNPVLRNTKIETKSAQKSCQKSVTQKNVKGCIPKSPLCPSNGTHLSGSPKKLSKSFYDKENQENSTSNSPNKSPLNSKPIQKATTPFKLGIQQAFYI